MNQFVSIFSATDSVLQGKQRVSVIMGKSEPSDHVSASQIFFAVSLKRFKGQILDDRNLKAKRRVARTRGGCHDKNLKIVLATDNPALPNRTH